MKAETGTRIEVMSKQVEEVSQSIHDLLPKDSVETVLANTGVIPSWAAAYSPNSASHDSLIEVGLSEHAHIGAIDAIHVLRRELTRAYPQTRFSYSLIDPVASALNYGGMSAIDLRLISPKLEKGQEIALDLLSRVKEVHGVTDAFVEQELNYPAIHIDVDRTKAAYVGLNSDEVIKNIITALNSSVLFSPNFWDDPVSGNNYFIGAMYPEREITSRQLIENIPLLPSPSGMLTPTQGPDLGGSWKSASGRTREPPCSAISRLFRIPSFRSRSRITTFSGSSTSWPTSTAATSAASPADIDSVLKKVTLPKGFSLRWAGQVDAMRASFGSMGVGMVLSLVLIFLLMVAQLKSLIDPLLILATVPMGFIGVIWMLFLTNTTLNIQSMMGMIMLIGIVVSNTVILTDYANARLESGISPTLAIREAGSATSPASDLDDGDLGRDGAAAILAQRRQRPARARRDRRLAELHVPELESFLPALYVLVKERKPLTPIHSAGAVTHDR